MTKAELQKLDGDFTWDYGCEYLIDTLHHGKYIWSDPKGGGDGVIKKFFGKIKDWEKTKKNIIDKGRHYIDFYCGDFKFEE